MRQLRERPSGSLQTPTVRAAGGVLLRPAGRGRLEVVCVHRPGRNDWSLPKGKLQPGESFEECALREVLEETGYTCELGVFAGSTEYVDRRRRPKVVAYWYMDPAPGASFHVAADVSVDEIDDVRWVELAVAKRALTYPHDRDLLDAVDREEVAVFG
ncbi:MAG TPA: NUDIX hydrolase [Acidimicrobiales bacterium]|nr:NUDIX hydrolase [Acidimicrobiales bacterium]